jgi:hypothetical protein
MLSRGVINALIEDLAKGNGAAKPAGRPKKDGQDNLRGTPQITPDGRGGAASKNASSLSARLAESTDPKNHAAWVGYLEGKRDDGGVADRQCRRERFGAIRIPGDGFELKMEFEDHF